MNTYEFLVSVLSVLVTALVGLNVIQVIFARSTMKRIASDTVADVSKDVSLLLRLKNLRTSAYLSLIFGKRLRAIDTVFSVIEETERCHVESFRVSASHDALLLLTAYLEHSQAKGGIYILQGRRSHYESILGRQQDIFRGRCLYLLKSALDRTEEEEALLWSPKGTLRIEFPEAPERYL